MPSTTNLLTFFTTLLLLFSCKSTAYTPEDFPKAQLIFGKGGGFAGTEETFYLLENGILFKQANRNATPEQVQKLEKATVKDIFAQARELKLAEQRFKQPGNMYAFLEWRTPTESNRIVWDAMGASSKADAQIIELHQALMGYTLPMR